MPPSFKEMADGNPTMGHWSFGSIRRTTGKIPGPGFKPSGSKTIDLAKRITPTEHVIPPDRLIDWTYSGIPGGIPARATIHRTLQPGATASEISAALSAASGSGQTVFLSAGTYNLDAQLDLRSVEDATLRGAGAGKTILNFTSGGTYSIASGPTSLFSAAIKGGTDISSGYTKGSTSITLAASPPSSFRVDNLIQIVQDDDYILVFHRTGNWAGRRNLRHTSRITGVSGNTITFATPIPHSYNAAYHPQANARPANSRMVGVENLTVRANNKMAITFGRADRCWVKGVETSGTANSAIEFRASSQCEVRRCYVHDAYGFPDQSDGYGIFLFYGSSYCRIEDNIGHNMANVVLMNGASGNAILYNFDWALASGGREWIRPSINSNHGPHGIMNLFEGNAVARFQNDGYHGSTSHGLLFRNHIHGIHPDGWEQERRLVDLARGSYFHSLIGNVIGSPSWTPKYYELTGSPGHYDNSCIYILGYPNMGNTTLEPATDWENYSGSYPDEKVAATLLRHGNYDYYNRSVVWDGAIVSRVIPASLIYSSKPEYFGSLQWPPIGPDVGGLVNDIPAKARWNAYTTEKNIECLFGD